MEYNPYDPLLQEDETQPFRKLFAAESAFMASEGYFQNERTTGFRQYAVSFIEENSKCENFEAFVPYLAMNYFDRFISRHKLPKVISNEEENAKLLVICCLTIAWKMRIKSFRVDQFLKERKLQFNRNHVKEMELHILNALQWRMRSLTPICFIRYFIPLLWLPSSSRRLNRRPVYQIIVKVQADIGFTQFKPSIVAASAILTAISKLFPAQFYESKAVISSCEFVSSAELMRCMEAMETMYKADEAFGTPTGRSVAEESSSGVGTSKPIDIGLGEASSSLLQAAEPPGVGTVQAPTSLLRAALPPGARADDEEPISHRSGKEQVGESVATQPAASEIVEMHPAASDDPFMDFELQWTDPQVPKVTVASVLPALSASGPGGPTTPSPWIRGICNCCPILDWSWSSHDSQNE